MSRVDAISSALVARLEQLRQEAQDIRHQDCTEPFWAL